jgi:DNA-binding Lrp family transcriptional regulator
MYARPVEINAVGDLVLSDPAAMRALGDSDRLTLHDRLRRDGASTVAELAASLDAKHADVQERLRILEAAGLVERDGPRWSVVGKGIFVQIPDDPEGQEAARQLSNTMLLQYVDLPRRWVAESEPRLTLEWARAAGLFNARVTLTADELGELQERLEELLAPYLTRDVVPEAADDVRILAYFMPQG